MSRRNLRSPRSSRPPRRKLVWADSQGDTTVAVGNFLSVDALGEFSGMPGASTVGATVVRIHSRLWVTSSVTNGDGISWSFIVDQVDEVEDGPGIPTSTAHVLSPTFSPNADWMIYTKWNAHPAYSFQGAVNNLELDIRSKRKIPELGDTLLMVVENIDATDTITIAYHTRSLLMLP